jgi:hypothetical protein
MIQSLTSRRKFLVSSAAGVSGAWLTANWPGVAAAADHAAHMATAAVTAPTKFVFLTAEEAADIDAIAAQIIPSGATPGARDAHAVYFIDQAFATFNADLAPSFRQGLAAFQRAFREARPSSGSFASASAADQLAYLKTVDTTPFFEAVRQLTVLGTLSASRYGGNFEGKGWQMMHFEDQHIFVPPFGYYDRDYSGFVPYAKEGAS